MENSEALTESFAGQEDVQAALVEAVESVTEGSPAIESGVVGVEHITSLNINRVRSQTEATHRQEAWDHASNVIGLDFLAKWTAIKRKIPGLRNR